MLFDGCHNQFGWVLIRVVVWFMVLLSAWVRVRAMIMVTISMVLGQVMVMLWL